MWLDYKQKRLKKPLQRQRFYFLFFIICIHVFFSREFVPAVSKVIARVRYTPTHIMQHKISEKVVPRQTEHRLTMLSPAMPDTSANMHTQSKVLQKPPLSLVVLQIMFTFIMLVRVIPMPVPKTRQFGPRYFGKNHMDKIMHNPPAK